MQGSGFRVQGSGFRVQGAGFRVQDSGFRAQDLLALRVHVAPLAFARHAHLRARKQTATLQATLQTTGTLRKLYKQRLTRLLCKQRALHSPARCHCRSPTGLQIANTIAHIYMGLLLHRNVQRFRGGLVFKAHRLCVSLNPRLESNKEEKKLLANQDTHRSGVGTAIAQGHTGVPRS